MSAVLPYSARMSTGLLCLYRGVNVAGLGQLVPSTDPCIDHASIYMANPVIDMGEREGEQRGGDWKGITVRVAVHMGRM